MGILDDIRRRAGQSGLRVVLSEGTDPRVQAAAREAAQLGLAGVVLVGDRDAIVAAMGEPPDGVTIEDPATSALAGQLAAGYHHRRKARGVTYEKAQQAVTDPLVFAAMMVAEGQADGTVGGAVSPTPDILRAALQCIGKADNQPLVSSFFLMAFPDDHPSGRDVLVFSDSGMVIDPDAEELAAIAAQAADSYAALTARTPRVAMLSFSTKGSARHERVTRVATATGIVQSARPDLIVDGELQFDAAIVPGVAASKAPGSPVEGAANVLVFPNLDAGNIGYKIAQRLGGAQAIGPVLQGLAKPANDLSRGCTASDIVNMIAVTILQAQAGTRA